MQTLIFHPSDELYGADRVALSVARVLSSNGHTVALTLPTDVAYPAHALCEAVRNTDEEVLVTHVNWPAVRRAYLSPKRFPGFASRALKWAITGRRSKDDLPDLVIANTSASLVAAALQPTSIGGKKVLYLHESLSQKDRLLLAPFIARMDSILAVSAACAKTAPRRAQSKMSVLHNGFPDLNPRDLVEKSRSDSKPTTFLLASRWNSWKGHEQFLRAWKLASTHDKELVILGGPPASGQSYDVATALTDLQIHNARIIGEVADPTPYIADADVIVVPSQAPDPLPTIAIEAMRQRRPVLASRTGGLTEIVTDETGWLVAPEDIDGWVDLITRLDSQTADGFRASARARYEEAFSEERYHLQINDYLSRLTSTS